MNGIIKCPKCGKNMMVSKHVNEDNTQDVSCLNCGYRTKKQVILGGTTMKTKIDLEKFICSYVKWNNIQDALKDQGLKYCNGKIVEIPQESEDERIRKEIYNALRYLETELSWDALGRVDILDAYAWLEKQGEHNKWNEEDEKRLQSIINTLECDIKQFTNTTDIVETQDNILWLKSLNPPKSEWTEEDERMIKEIISDVKFEGYNNDMQANSYKKINWLKSLKDRYTWKPSDEQMKALKEACDEHWEPDGLDPLYELYEQLKNYKK